MAKALKKAAVKKKAAAKRIPKKKTVPKKAAKKQPARPKSPGKNKLGVKNSLVNNINKRREKGVSRSRKKSTVSKAAYKKMEDNWTSKSKK